MSSIRRALPLPPLLLLAACGQEPQDIVDYRLVISPIVAYNQQDLFAGLTELKLVVETPSGQPQEYALPSGASGTSPEVTDLPTIPEGSIVHVMGYLGTGPAATLAAYGHTEPLSLGAHDELTIEVLVTRVNAYAQFYDLPVALWGSALAPTGDGRFLLFGGCEDIASDKPSDLFDEILLLETASAEGGLAFQPFGTLPATEDLTEDGEPLTGRCGATATLLSKGSHSDMGQILVIGGGAPMGLGHATYQSFLLDPDSGTIEQLDGLKSSRASHTSILMDNGKIAIFGGWGKRNGSSWITRSTPEIYDPATRSFAYVVSDRTFMVGNFGAGAPLGSDSAIYCGGFVSGTSGADVNHNTCYIVKSDLSIRQTAAIPGIPSGESLLASAMARLETGKILLLGGVSATMQEDPREEIEADSLDQAWIYNETGDSWETLPEPMMQPRAFHHASPLKDGRVLITGGAGSVHSLDLYQANSSTTPTATPCAEIFDPESGDFTMVDDCNGSTTGSLPGQMMSMSGAQDPDWGNLFAGGAKDFAGALTPYVVLFVEGPELSF